MRHPMGAQSRWTVERMSHQVGPAQALADLANSRHCIRAFSEADSQRPRGPTDTTTLKPLSLLLAPHSLSALPHTVTR